MKQVRIGVAGLAHIHVAGYLQMLSEHPGAVLAGLWDEDIARARGLAERFHIPAYERLEGLLGQGLDLMVVCSENTRHLTLVLQAARAGVHVLCEKPLGTDLDEMKAMIDACRAGGAGLMTAFPNRYVQDIARARALVRGGALGELRAVKATNKGKMPGGFFIDPALSGGGSLMDHVVHVADLMNWFLGDIPQWVCALGGTVLHPELTVDDVSMVHFGYPCGVTVTLDSSWSRSEKFPSDRNLTLDLTGTQGNLAVDIVTDHSRVLSDLADREVYVDFGENKVRRMLYDAVDRVGKGEEFAVTGEDGLRAAAVALAAIASFRSGRPEPVRL